MKSLRLFAARLLHPLRKDGAPHSRHARAEWLTRAGLLFGTCLNFAYAIFRAINGFISGSLWMCAEAGYYAILGTVRSALVREDNRDSVALHYRPIGCLLLLLAAMMAGIVAPATFEQRSPSHTEATITGAALFALWRVSNAIYYRFRFRQQKSLILLCAKTLSLCTALLSLFGLQASLFDEWEQNKIQRILLNVISGGSVCFLLVTTGIRMLRSSKQSVG